MDCQLDGANWATEWACIITKWFWRSENIEIYSWTEKAQAEQQLSWALERNKTTWSCFKEFRFWNEQA